MLLQVGLGLAAFTAVVVPTAASSAQDTIGQLFDKADEIYTEKGYTGTGWERRGELAQGKEQLIQVTLSGAASYQLIGVCDTDCKNLDIQLLDANGKEVDKDVEDDDFPIVGALASGPYTARVTMTACEGSCAFGLKAFAK
ncbi:hypothetical protein IAG41_02450 [Sphingomonas sp. JC676]|uniref:hypothetical protein n=1 Tax=Sphingomonas sp. JC676 TaxID=2768065 RepID=UPI001658164E|nr:hypothetical protein [Sphingomonas sp. JC676]MBC9031240.1 hypothetical protein [Sphingomonas sp. JC676]